MGARGLSREKSKCLCLHGVYSAVGSMNLGYGTEYTFINSEAICNKKAQYKTICCHIDELT